MKKTNFVLLAMLVASLSSKAQTVFQAVPQTDTLAMIEHQVSRDAQFPGGDKAWNKFLSDSVDLSVPAKHGALAGSYCVFIEFNVTKKGKVTQVQPRTTLGYGMEAEVIRVIKMSPDWLPAISNDKKVSSIRTQAVWFVVSKTK